MKKIMKEKLINMKILYLAQKFEFSLRDVDFPVNMEIFTGNK